MSGGSTDQTYSLMLSRGNKLRGSFSLTPFKVTLCLLACAVHQSPVMEEEKRLQLYRYIVSQLKVISLSVRFKCALERKWNPGEKSKRA